MLQENSIPVQGLPCPALPVIFLKINHGPCTPGVPHMELLMHVSFDLSYTWTLEAALYWVKPLVCQDKYCLLWLAAAIWGDVLSHHLLPDPLKWRCWELNLEPFACKAGALPWSPPVPKAGISMHISMTHWQVHKHPYQEKKLDNQSIGCLMTCVYLPELLFLP